MTRNPVTLVVDSAMRWVCKNKRIDMAVIGADAITSEGTVLNKIGSRLLALVAKEDGIPLYVASQLLKYSQETLFGTHEDIDMRGPEEVWSSVHDVKRGPRPEGVHILNPAFESVNRYYRLAYLGSRNFPERTSANHVCRKIP